MSFRQRVRSRLSPSGRRRAWILLGLLLGIGGVVSLLFILDRRGARVDPAPPEAVDRGVDFAELEPSYIDVPVIFDLARGEEALEERVPVRFGDLSERRTHPSIRRVDYSFAAEREPLRLELRSDTVRLTTVMEYRGRVWYDPPFGSELTASCGAEGPEAPGPRAVVTLTSPLELDPEWRIRTNLEVERMEPLTDQARDRCRIRVLALDLDATELLISMAESGLRDRLEEIDSELARIDLRPALEAYWREMRTPLRLDEGVWFALDPVGVRRGRLGAAGPAERTLRAELGLVARPRVVLGPRPELPEVPLPPLEEGPMEGGLAVLVEGRIDYGPLSERLTGALRDREFEAAGRSVRVREVRASGLEDGRMAVELEVEGALRGRLFLVGTPALDRSRNEITVPDLTFSVATRNLLTRAATWLLRTGFPEHVRRHARFPLDETLERGRVLASRGLNHQLSPEIRLEGEMGSLEIVEVGALPDALWVRSRLEGSARLIVEDG